MDSQMTKFISKLKELTMILAALKIFFCMQSVEKYGALEY
jgi:hypothetical protein